MKTGPSCTAHTFKTFLLGPSSLFLIHGEKGVRLVRRWWNLSLKPCLLNQKEKVFSIQLYKNMFASPTLNTLHYLPQYTWLSSSVLIIFSRVRFSQPLLSIVPRWMQILQVGASPRTWKWPPKITLHTSLTVRQRGGRRGWREYRGRKGLGEKKGRWEEGKGKESRGKGRQSNSET